MQGVALSFSNNNGIMRQPRLRAVLNDITILIPYSAQITHHSSFAAGSYRLLVSLAGNSSLTVADWVDIGQVRIRIQVCVYPHEAYSDLIEGYVDSIDINPITGSVHLEGRDLSASLLDTKTPTDFQNLSSTEIVTRLSHRHGLTPVGLPTTGYAGRHYADIYNVMSMAQFAKLSSDWDILSILAQTAGRDLFVDGTDLHFQPRVTISDVPQDLVVSDLMDLRMIRSLPHSGGTAVTIASWNSALGVAVNESHDTRAPTGLASAATRPSPTFTVLRPNLQSSAAQTLATQMARSIASDAMSIQFTMPGDVALSARRPLRLAGSGTAFDVSYQIDTINRVFRANSGLSQKVLAKMLVKATT